MAVVLMFVQTCLWPGHLTPHLWARRCLPAGVLWKQPVACLFPCPQALAGVNSVVYSLHFFQHHEQILDKRQLKEERIVLPCGMREWAIMWEKPGMEACGCLLTSRQRRKQGAGDAGAQLAFPPLFLIQSGAPAPGMMPCTFR